MYKKILVGVDNSEHAMKAVEKAIELHKTDKSEIVVFHSVLHKFSELRPTFNITVPSSLPLSYEIQQDRRKEAQELLDDIKKKFDESDVPVDTRLTFDVGPQYYIERKVDEEGFDLVILGCAGEHNKFRRTLLGTVPEYVLNNVNADILIVK
ncbi:MAG: universal stress protein [Promethearchaeota archaeon]|jgi:nucleotide-binding universal stress UspA family protein